MDFPDFYENRVNALINRITCMTLLVSMVTAKVSHSTKLIIKVGEKFPVMYLVKVRCVECEMSIIEFWWAVNVITSG